VDDVLALRALAAILADDALAKRFLALTGLDAETLRARAGKPDVTEAVADFLLGHEPDLLAIASRLGVPPERLAA
jgi:hypothetical protein